MMEMRRRREETQKIHDERGKKRENKRITRKSIITTKTDA